MKRRIVNVDSDFASVRKVGRNPTQPVFCEKVGLGDESDRTWNPKGETIARYYQRTGVHSYSNQSPVYLAQRRVEKGKGGAFRAFNNDSDVLEDFTVNSLAESGIQHLCTKSGFQFASYGKEPQQSPTAETYLDSDDCSTDPFPDLGSALVELAPSRVGLVDLMRTSERPHKVDRPTRFSALPPDQLTAMGVPEYFASGSERVTSEQVIARTALKEIFF